MLNRKAHIGTMMLVIIAFALVGTALFIYYTSKNTLEDNDKVLADLIGNFEYNEKYVRGAFFVLVEEARINALRKNELPFESAFKSELSTLANKKRELWKDKTNLFGKLGVEDVITY